MVLHVFTCLLVATVCPRGTRADLVFSAGFSDDAVLQRSSGPEGASIYGFTDSAAAVTLSVHGTDARGKAVSYMAPAEVKVWQGRGDVHPDTPPPPPHGNWVWRAALHPSEAGGSLTVSVSNGGVNGTSDVPL